MTNNQTHETQLDPDNLPTFVSVKQFADYFQLTQTGVIRIIRKGELHAIRLTSRGSYRIPSTEVTRILDGNV